MNGVDRPQLAEAVDSADALFEPNRIPRKLEIDDKAASRLKVESFGARICCQQKVGDAGIERVNSGSSFDGRQTTMQQCDAPKRPQCVFEHGERVSILGKHHRRFRHATKQANERAHFALVKSGSVGNVEDGSERLLLLLDTIECRSREQGRRVGSTFILLEMIEWQPGLNHAGVMSGETREPSFDRHGKRRRARHGALAQHHRDQLRAPRSVASANLPQSFCISRQQPMHVDFGRSRPHRKQMDPARPFQTHGFSGASEHQ